MKPLVANVGHVVCCVNCGNTRIVPPEVFAKVSLFVCAGRNCSDRNAVVEVFDRIGASV
jgi:hypothetical protein